MTIYAHVSLEDKRQALARARRGAGMTRLLSALLSIAGSALGELSIAPGQRWWSGAGSNRRPSAFQADAHTD
jgi:hypothetical protein